ncbi:CAP domain-containing protein [Streptomyces syringium]|uniref:CAP domain-containing protein n=1 Tax=Streptomyces syringium TaxID=76729 RepID=UPI0033C3CBA4
MNELTAGVNRALPDGALSIHVPGPFDLSVIVTDESGRVAGDADFVFFNQPSGPGARLRGDTVVVDPRRLRAGAGRVTVVVSPAVPGTPLGRLPVPVMTVTNSAGHVLFRFTPPGPTRETVLLLAELYRRGAGWKLRALGQGYADGLAGVARDFGVDVLDDTDPPAGTLVEPTGDEAAFLRLVNAERAAGGAAPVALEPRLVTAARAHAAGMAAHGRLGVESPDGTSLFHRMATGGYRCLNLAEHLVSGPRTPDEFVAYCLAGTERGLALREGDFTHVGIGRAVGGGRLGDVYWTALWARPFTEEGLARFTSEVVTLTNAERTAAGLRPLAVDARLTLAAQGHSDDMTGRDFYSHTTPEGREPWDRAAAAGCPHRGIGENIACGQRSPAEVLRGWMDSPGHRANILTPHFTHIGIGYATGSRAGTYWTQLFGASV